MPIQRAASLLVGEQGEKMKKALIALVGAVASLNSTVGVTADVRYDRFKDRTEISATIPPTANTYSPIVAAIFKGEVPAADVSAQIYWMGAPNNWKYMRCHSMRFLVDGKGLAPTDNKFDGKVQRGYVLETIIVTFPYENLKQMASAQKIEMQVCNDESVVGTDFQNLMKDVVDTVEKMRVARPRAATTPAKQGADSPATTTSKLGESCTATPQCEGNLWCIRGVCTNPP